MTVCVRWSTALAVVVVLTACGAVPRVDLNAEPLTVAFAIPRAIGSEHTLGMTGPAVDAPRPLRITSVRVEVMTGVEVAGIGAFDPNELGQGLGFVPGWPPDGYELTVFDDALYRAEWHGDVYTVVGLRTTEARAGMRGVTVEWIDAAGQTGIKTFDIAVVWCGVERCSDEVRESYGPLLRELGLMR